MTAAAGSAVVLFVEDEVATRLAGVHALEEAGFTVLQAECVAEALAILARRDDIAVVVTEARLSGERDGGELARLLNRQAPWIRTVVTSGARQHSRSPSPLLSKPYRAEDLASLVAIAAIAASRPDSDPSG